MATSLEFPPIYLSGTQGLGAFSLTLLEDGGLVSEARLRVGYGRRELETISCRLPFAQVVDYSDRFDFLGGCAYNYAAASALEEILEIEVPVRAEYIRVILLELNRLNSHLYFLARLARAAGQESVFQYCLRERERFADVFEMYSGSRLGFGSICLGGVRENATDGWFFRIEKAIHSLREFLPELEALLFDQPFFRERMEGLATVSRTMAEARNLSGPNARSAGFARDLRLQTPYLAYRDLRPKPLRCEAGKGDAWSRAIARKAELAQSAELLETAMAKIPDGNFRIKVGYEVEAPPGWAYRRAEGPRGEVGVYVNAGGGRTPAATRIFPPSAMVVQVLPEVLREVRVDDALLAIQSLDISFSEVDK